MIAEDECTLCGEVLGMGDLALWPRITGTKAPSRIICEDESLVALVTIGPIVKGHCLIMPKSHLKSMAALDGVEKRRAKVMLEWVSDSLLHMYGTSVLLFEHGTTEGGNCKPCSVGHAHWHVVPTAIGVNEMLTDNFAWEKISDPFIEPSGDYLLVGDTRTEYWAASLQEPAPSQVLRKRLAFCMGRLRRWDWRTDPGIELMLETITDFQKRAGKRPVSGLDMRHMP